MSAVGRVDVGPEKSTSSTKIKLKQVGVRAGIKVRVPEQPQESRAPGEMGMLGLREALGIKLSNCKGTRAGRVSATRPCSYRSVVEDRV